MNQKDAENIINILRNSNEISWIEAKDSLLDHKKIGETFSALANSASYKNEKYGYLIWGIENKTWRTLGTKFSLKQLKPKGQTGEIWLNEKLNKQCHWDEYEFMIKKKRIVIVQIKNCWNNPISFEKIPYIRIGEHNQLLSSYPEIQRAILFKKENYDFSAQACEEASFGDLDDDAIMFLREKLSRVKDNSEWKDMKLENMLNRIGLLTDWKINNTCLLFLGKSEFTNQYLIDINKISWKYSDDKY